VQEPGLSEKEPVTPPKESAAKDGLLNTPWASSLALVWSGGARASIKESLSPGFEAPQGMAAAGNTRVNGGR
jgi:hypothetical protein